MINNKNTRAASNLAMLEFVARKLGKLNEEVVYLGGCSTALLITDPVSLDVRPTWDVDCIIDVISFGQYNQFSSKLKKQGFKQLKEDDILCRWHYDDLILDVMPTDEKILGFGNLWYKEAIDYAMDHKIADDLFVKSITAPYFLATKIEAFKTRGKNDFLGSHDFEDIIAVINGRVEVAEEIFEASPALKKYLGKIFTDMFNNDQFHLALPGLLNDGLATQGRTQMVLKRVQQIAKLNENG